MAITRQASSATSVTLLSANALRKHCIIVNDDSARMYVTCDSSAASTTNYTFSIAQNENGALPQGYTGEVRAIWASANSGGACITTY